LNRRSPPDEILVDTIYKIFAAFRALTDDADHILDREGLGRAHFRALGVIARQPGATVSEVIATLGITIQAINRVMNDLQGRALISARTDKNDRRRRRLYLTQAGKKIFDQAMAAQIAVLRQAAEECSADKFAAYRQFLAAMATPLPPVDVTE
jgi:DNA-binding MarR family transcriptional regulator